MGIIKKKIKLKKYSLENNLNMKKLEIAFLFPLYNEANRVLKIRKFHSFAKKKFKNFKLIFLLNDCKDNTAEIIIKNYELIYSKSKNRGAGMNIAFRKIKCNYFAICAVDNAWSFDFYTRAYKILKRKKIKIVYGPKSHPKSLIQRSQIRNLISILSIIFFKIFFKNDINFDCQCIKMFSSDLKFIKKLNNFNYFAETEFAIIAKQKKVNISLIPVKIRNTRGSKINILNLVNYIFEALSFKFLRLYK